MRKSILRSSIVACALAFGVGVASQASAQDRINRRQRPQIARPGSRAESETRARTQIAREVRRELATLPYYDVFDFLQFEVQPDFTVVLSGQTVRPTLKRDAEARLRDVEGIERVVNNIEVLPLSSLDDRIRVAVYRELFNFDSPLYRYSLGAVPPIRIIVNRGRVTLKGIVATKGDSNLAYIRARTVPGTFEVTNELQIERDGERRG